VSERQQGPGLAKARRPELVASLHAVRVRGADVRWRELLESADAMSEGGVRAEAGGAVWYGSTSLVLRLPDPTSAEESAFLAAVADRDVHVRLRVLRIAHREATLRAPAPLGRIHCEIHVQPDPRGVRIDVDVQAPLIESPALAGPTRH
jgi:hypothetical protein